MEQDTFKAIQLETLHGCNLNCKTCPNSVIPKNKELMDEKIFFKVLDDLVDINYGGRISPYLMNEPTLDKRIPRFIKEIRKKFPRNMIMIGSNGVLLDDKMIKEYFEAGLTRFTITCYSKPIYDKLKHWEGDTERFKFLKVFEQDTEVVFFNRAGNVKVGENEFVMETCSKGTKQAFVNYLGDVVLCCSDYRYEVVAGNVMKEPLIEIYNSPMLKHYREKLLNRDRRGLKLCSVCNWHRTQQQRRKK